MTKINNDIMLSEKVKGNLCDFALFLSVMKNKEAYECVLSIIMNEKNLVLKEVKVEEVILNQPGKRAIRLDAWAVSMDERQFNMEMQNDTKREDIFEQDSAMYVFTEQCDNIQGLHLEDGTKKIFLNMKSRNGRPELISLLQYMKDSRLDNPEIIVLDDRLIRLDKIVQEVKQTEEWEDVKMTIMEYAMEKGTEIGKEIGTEIGKEIGIKAFVIDGIEEKCSTEKIIEKLKRFFGLDEIEARAYYDKFSA